MSSLRQLKLERARAYVLAHPDESKAEQAIGADVSERLIAIARADLVKRGLLVPSRKVGNIEHTLPRSPSKRSSAVEMDAPAAGGDLLNHSAMTSLAATAETIEELDFADDEAVQKRLLRQCISFALNPKLHPDTRMSASQMWAKIRDIAKGRQIGPGAPLTFEDATARLRDLNIATGPSIAIAAIRAAFPDILQKLIAVVGPEETMAAIHAVFEVRDASPGDETQSAVVPETAPSTT